MWSAGSGGQFHLPIKDAGVLATVRGGRVRTALRGGRRLDRDQLQGAWGVVGICEISARVFRAATRSWREKMLNTCALSGVSDSTVNAPWHRTAQNHLTNVYKLQVARGQVKVRVNQRAQSPVPNEEVLHAVITIAKLLLLLHAVQNTCKHTQSGEWVHAEHHYYYRILAHLQSGDWLYTVYHYYRITAHSHSGKWLPAGYYYLFIF